MNKIRILITGGTIDDLNYEKEEDAPINHESLIPDLVEQSRITSDYEMENLMQKDSRVVTDEDRKIILDKCREVSEDKIVVTHGTFTMPETAKFLSEANLPKTIVLFGAAIPANKDKSDALFNLGAAFIAVQILPPGVYLVMNGRVFDSNKVRKNLETGNFEEIN